MENVEYANNFLIETKKAIDKILDSEKINIDSAIEILFDAWKNKNQVFIFGNGGSAANASHFFCDLVKTPNTEGKNRFVGMCLNDNAALFSAHVNDNGWENVYVEQLTNYMKHDDVVIAISVHGGHGKDKGGAWSQNLLKAVDYANKNKARTIGLSGFDGGALKSLANICITVPINSTPHVEPIHTLLHHLICERLKEKIVNY